MCVPAMAMAVAASVADTAPPVVADGSPPRPLRPPGSPPRGGGEQGVMILTAPPRVAGGSPPRSPPQGHSGLKVPMQGGAAPLAPRGSASPKVPALPPALIPRPAAQHAAAAGISSPSGGAAAPVASGVGERALSLRPRVGVGPPHHTASAAAGGVSPEGARSGSDEPFASGASPAPAAPPTAPPAAAPPAALPAAERRGRSRPSAPTAPSSSARHHAPRDEAAGGDRGASATAAHTAAEGEPGGVE